MLAQHTTSPILIRRHEYFKALRRGDPKQTEEDRLFVLVVVLNPPSTDNAPRDRFNKNLLVSESVTWVFQLLVRRRVFMSGMGAFRG